jgi:hypothetical protein
VADVETREEYLERVAGMTRAEREAEFLRERGLSASWLAELRHAAWMARVAMGEEASS